MSYFALNDSLQTRSRQFCHLCNGNCHREIKHTLANDQYRQNKDSTITVKSLQVNRLFKYCDNAY